MRARPGYARGGVLLWQQSVSSGCWGDNIRAAPRARITGLWRLAQLVLRGGVTHSLILEFIK